MPASDSIQHKLSRVRPPRVQITYDVEIGDAIQMKELPFVMGIIADLSGDRDPDRKTPKLEKYKDRQFQEIDRDNFGDTMATIRPRLSYSVKNTMVEDGDGSGNVAVDLEFNSIEDFEPLNVIQQVPALKELFEARRKLLDLQGKLDGNDDLDELLQAIIADDKHKKAVKKLIESDRKASEDKDG